ncbi:glycosyltransferase involved in cell wall biosynthesis [Thioalkalivibrio sp. ALE21]|uniref:glycosyltransferase n=1 Tax=Thioalkalivibrio sp. ALE21 TaxID=1158175 RepID=UPI000D9C17D1|nr:glycosyltransferase [Thioalkalivibrio sp. ALE21]PYF99995.1 glycosyltransferase involved in cell wall biosynthesis [Thioalkalivibrio sp. ALE21]
MNIIYATPQLLPSLAANTIQTAKMCNALSESGHSVAIFGESPRGISHSVWRRRVREHYGLYPSIALEPFTGGRLRISRVASYAVTFLRLMRKSRYDVVYTRSIVFGVLASLSRKYTLLEVHDLPSARQRMVIKALSKFGLKIASPSRSLLRYLRRFGGYKTAILHWLPHGVDCLSDGSERLERFSLNRAFVCAYAGSSKRGKGLALMDSLASRMPDVGFRLIVSGGVPEDLKASIENKGNTEVFYDVPPWDVKRLLGEAEVLLNPVEKYIWLSESRKSRQLAPLKSAEYLGYGKPIVASAIWPNKEMFGPLGAAILCPAAEVRCWEEQIGKLRASLEARGGLASRAVQAAKVMAWSQRVERFEAIWK